MKTYYDGEEREILSVKFYYTDTKHGEMWIVTYRRGESLGKFILCAKDELDAFNKFPEALAQASVIHEEF